MTFAFVPPAPLFAATPRPAKAAAKVAGQRWAGQIKKESWIATGQNATPAVNRDLAIDNVAQRMNQLLGQLRDSPDEDAFSELFRHFAPRLKSYLRKLGAAEDAAEELAQEAMAMVWRKAHLFDPERAGASTWIFSIARNLRIDSFRRQRRPDFQMDDPALVPDEPVSPEVHLNLGQQAKAVRLAMASLPADQARIVHLSFFEDKPHAAIADELGIPLGTVKSRMRLAFQRFRKALGETQP